MDVENLQNPKYLFHGVHFIELSQIEIVERRRYPTRCTIYLAWSPNEVSPFTASKHFRRGFA